MEASITPATGDGDASEGPSESTVVTDPRRRRLILVAMCLALIAVVASVSGLNTAQQVLAEDLGASQGELLWAINGYTLALAALLFPIGAIGDRIGRKPILLAGLAIFAVASVGSAVASDPMFLIASRVLAGVGAAMIMPVTLSVITSSFPAEDRGQAVGIWAGFAGAGGILGLVSSAAIVDYATWPWVFVAPMVAAVVAGVVSIAVVPNSREHHTSRFDTAGALLSAVAVGGLVLGIHEGPEQGWTAPITVIGIAVGLVAAVAFVVWELRHDHPMLDVRLFRHRTLATGTIGMVALFAVMFALFLVMVQYLQVVLEWSALKSAMGLLPMAVLMMPLSTVAPRISQRLGYRNTLFGGLLLTVVGVILLGVAADPSSEYVDLLPGLFVLSMGVGISMTPSTTAITESLPLDKQGVASALNDTTREFGSSLGIALIGSINSATYTSNVSGATKGLPAEVAHQVEEGIGGAVAVAPRLGERAGAVMDAARSAFVDGWAASMWVSAGVVAAAAIFVLVRGPRRGAEGFVSAAVEEMTASEGESDLVGVTAGD